MNEELKEEKIKRFMADENMVAAVKEVLRDSFLKEKNNADVRMLAAERIAINLLESGWAELRRFKAKKEYEPSTPHQVGL